MQFLKSTDFFRRIKSEHTQGWAAGGVISLIATVTMFALFLSEFTAYLVAEESVQVQMSGKADKQLRINFNVSMPLLPCQFASVDLKDVIGTNKVNMTTNIRKWKLQDNGKRRVAEMHEVAQDPKLEKEGTHPEDPVEKAQVLTTKTFDNFIQSNDVVMVNFYAPWCHWSRRLMPTWHHTASLVSKKPYGYTTKIAMVDCTHADAVQVCRRSHIQAFPTVTLFRGNVHTHEFYHGDRTAEAFMKFIEAVRQKNHMEVHRGLGHKDGGSSTYGRGKQGCLISGFVMVNKVPGSLSIAAHSKYHTIAAALINTTHDIHHFSYGSVGTLKHFKYLKMYGHDDATRLSDTHWWAAGTNHTYEHYIKVINTVYEGSGKDSYDTYRYTVNSHEYQDNRNYPAVKFTYDISPMSVHRSRTSVPFYHFLTSLCAIIGGVFTVLGLFDSALFHGYKSVVTKRSLNKLG